MHTRIVKFSNGLYRVYTNLPGYVDASPPECLSDAKDTSKRMQKIAEEAWRKNATENN